MEPKEFNYWPDRYLDIKKAQISKAKNYEKSYEVRMKQTLKSIEQEIDAWCKKYALEDGTIDPLQAKKLLRGSELRDWKYTLSQWEEMAKSGEYEHELNLEYYKSRVSRLRELEAQVAMLMAKPTNDEIPHLEKLLKDNYTDTYYRTIYTRQMQTGQISGNFAYISENRLNAIVRSGWKGANFSERIWGNSTRILPKTLTETLFRGIALGYNQTDLMKLAKRKLKDFEDDDIHRLVVTESAYITEQATYNAYEESKVKKYEWIAALESSTCKIEYVINGKTYKGCGGLDGEVFDVGPNSFVPPLHPYCRCTTAPWDEILEQMQFTRWSRDPITGKSVDTEATTFKEWKEITGVEQEKALSKGEYGADLNYIRSNNFADKLKVESKISHIADSVARISRQIVQHRNGTPYEDYYLLDYKNGKTIAVSNKATKTKGVVYNEQVKQAFKNGKENQYLSIHNHPSGYPPSLSDIATLGLKSKHNTVGLGLTIGHDGSVYWYTKATKKFKQPDNENYSKLLDYFIKTGYNEVKAQELALQEFGAKFGFEFGKAGE